MAQFFCSISVKILLTQKVFPVLTRCRLIYGQRQAHLRIVSHRRKQFAFNFCHSVLIGPHYKHTLQ